MIDGFALSLDGNTPYLDLTVPPVTFTTPLQGSIVGNRAANVGFLLNYRFLGMDGDTPTLLPPVTNGLTVHMDGDTPYVDVTDLTPWPRSVGPDIDDPIYAP